MFTTYDVIRMIYKDYFAAVFRSMGGEQMLKNCPDMPEECADIIRDRIAIDDLRAAMAMIAFKMIGGL